MFLPQISRGANEHPKVELIFPSSSGTISTFAFNPKKRPPRSPHCGKKYAASGFSSSVRIASFPASTGNVNSAEWLPQQIVEAFPWNTAPTYLLRDNDGAYGQAFTRRVRTMGIRDRPISPRSPWQNPYVERLIGTLRRDCLDHVLIFGARHLRQILTSYCSYYNQSRTHHHWTRVRRCNERSSDVGPSLPRQFCPAYIINTRGYDFREGQPYQRWLG